MERPFDAESELSKLLSEEIAKGIDAEILKNVMEIDYAYRRKRRIGELWPEITDGDA